MTIFDRERNAAREALIAEARGLADQFHSHPEHGDLMWHPAIYRGWMPIAVTVDRDDTITRVGQRHGSELNYYTSVAEYTPDTEIL